MIWKQEENYYYFMCVLMLLVGFFFMFFLNKDFWIFYIVSLNFMVLGKLSRLEKKIDRRRLS